MTILTRISAAYRNPWVHVILDVAGEWFKALIFVLLIIGALKFLDTHMRYQVKMARDGDAILEKLERIEDRACVTGEGI